MYSEELNFKPNIVFNISAQNKQVKCCKGNKASLICIKDTCVNNAFLCMDQNCKCKQVHQDCGFSITLHKIQKMLQNKIQPYKDIAKTIQTKIQKAIDELSDFAETIKATQLRYQHFIGLTQNQSILLKALKSGQAGQIKGKDVCQIQQSLKKQTEKQYQIAQKNIQKSWLQMNQQIQLLKASINQSLFRKIDTKVQQTKDLQTQLIMEQLKNSSILNSNEQIQRLLKFFDKKIKNVELLYRATRDSFEVTEFHKRCDNITNTLTIVETTEDKKFGGYTPIQWKSVQYTFASDKELKSFIFQLDQNDKFSLKPEEYFWAICRDETKGPTFGAGHDLSIQNDANINYDSFASICACYQNISYIQGDDNSYQKFSGDQYFTVKDYEVWRITFVD